MCHSLSTLSTHALTTAHSPHSPPLHTLHTLHHCTLSTLSTTPHSPHCTLSTLSTLSTTAYCPHSPPLHTLHTLHHCTVASFMRCTGDGETDCRSCRSHGDNNIVHPQGFSCVRLFSRALSVHMHACTPPHRRVHGHGTFAATLGGNERTRKPLGMVRVCAHLVKTEGVSVLWRGSVMALARAASYGGLRLGMYHPIRDWLGGSDPSRGGADSFARKLAAGVLAGSTSAWLCSPLELLKTRQQSHPDHGHATRGLGDAVRKVVANGGVRALWSGANMAMIRGGVLTASQCAFYEGALTLGSIVQPDCKPQAHRSCMKVAVTNTSALLLVSRLCATSASLKHVCNGRQSLR
jgi:hypothetical protein